MKTLTEEERYIQRDRMIYIKNKTSANLAILAIVFDVLYFISIYKSDVGNWYYNILIGASIIYNLLFLLGAFLASEGAKNYKAGYTWLLFGLGIGQIIRIFILPLKAHTSVASIAGSDVIVMGGAQFTRVVIYLAASAVCLIIAGIVNYSKCNAIKAHLSSLEKKEAA